MKTLNAKTTLKIFEDFTDEQIKHMSNQQMFSTLKTKGYFYSTKSHKWMYTRSASVNEWNQNRLGMYSK